MKKMLSLVLLALLVSLAGCFNKDNKEEKTAATFESIVAYMNQRDAEVAVKRGAALQTGVYAQVDGAVKLYTGSYIAKLENTAAIIAELNKAKTAGGLAYFVIGATDEYLSYDDMLLGKGAADFVAGATTKVALKTEVFNVDKGMSEYADGTAVPVTSVLQSLTSSKSNFEEKWFIVKAEFKNTYTKLVAEDVTVTGAKNAVKVLEVSQIKDTEWEIKIGDVEDFSAEYSVIVKNVDKQEATKVFPFTQLKVDILDSINAKKQTVQEWMDATAGNALYKTTLETQVLANNELKVDAFRATTLCLEGNGSTQYYLSSWIEDSTGHTLTLPIEVSFIKIYGTLSKPTETFTVIDGYATNKLLSMKSDVVVLDKIKVRVTKTPENATGYLGRESAELPVAYMPTPVEGTTDGGITQKKTINLNVLRVENADQADRITIVFDKSLTAAANELKDKDLLTLLNEKNFINNLEVRDNIKNRNFRIIQVYPVEGDNSKVVAILEYNLVDAANPTQLLTDNYAHSLLVREDVSYTYSNVELTTGAKVTLEVNLTATNGIDEGIVRSLDFQLKDSTDISYMQIYTETYRQKVLKGEAVTAADKINMLVTKMDEFAIYVQYSEAVAFDAPTGYNVDKRLQGITYREGYANNLSNYTFNGRMLNSDVVSKVELFEENPLVAADKQKEADKHVRNTVKITFKKELVSAIGFNFKFGPDNKPVSEISLVKWPETKQNLFATNKTGDWAAINADKENIMDSEQKDNLKINIITNELPPAEVIVFVGNNNPEIWHPTNVKSYSKKLDDKLQILADADNFSPEQFIIKFSGDVYAAVNDLNTVVKYSYYNRTTTPYPAASMTMKAYKWEDYTKPISQATPVGDITTGFNAILVELADWSTQIVQPSMYYHNIYKETQFTIPENSVYIVDLILGQKKNAKIDIPVTLRQDWASPRVVTVASYDNTSSTAGTDVRYDEERTKVILIQNTAKQFLMKASEPIQVSDVIIEEDETLLQKWYQINDTRASTTKQKTGFTAPLTDENEVRFEFYNQDANTTYFGRVVGSTMNAEDTIWRVQPCEVDTTVMWGAEALIRDIDLAEVDPAKTFVYTRPDGKTKYAKWRLAIKKIADDAGNSMDTLVWNIEIEKVDLPPVITTEVSHEVAIGTDSPRVVWAKFARDVDIKIGDTYKRRTSAIFIKFSHVMEDNTINGVGVLSGYQLDKYRFDEKAQMLRGIYFASSPTTGITVTENWDGVTIVLPNNDMYDNNNGVHTIDVPAIKDIYGRQLIGTTELPLQPITTGLIPNVDRINSLDADNDGIEEAVSMWVNTYVNYDELNNEMTGNDFSRVERNRDNTTLRDVDLYATGDYLTDIKLHWDINAPYAKNLLKDTDPTGRTYVVTKYDELTNVAPKLNEKMAEVIGEFDVKGGDWADVAGITTLNLKATTYKWSTIKRVQVWLAVAKEEVTAADKSITTYRHILLSDLPINEDSLITADITALTAIMTVANAEVEANYTPASWANLVAAKALPQGTQAEVDAKVLAIQNALANLVPVAPVATLGSIAITTNPTKIVYTVGEAFSTAGMAITATMSDLSTKTVTGWTTSTPDMATAGTKTVTVSYTEAGVTKEATFTITVNPASKMTPTFGAATEVAVFLVVPITVASTDATIATVEVQTSAGTLIDTITIAAGTGSKTIEMAKGTTQIKLVGKTATGTKVEILAVTTTNNFATFTQAVEAITPEFTVTYGTITDVGGLVKNVPITITTANATIATVDVVAEGLTVDTITIAAGTGSKTVTIAPATTTLTLIGKTAGGATVDTVTKGL